MPLFGVECLVNARTGEATIDDVNAPSTFVANAPEVIGFDPFVQLVHLIVARAELNLGARGAPVLTAPRAPA